jgi:hypothetical protein
MATSRRLVALFLHSNPTSFQNTIAMASIRTGISGFPRVFLRYEVLFGSLLDDIPFLNKKKKATAASKKLF